jgi:hypothetical protein
MELTDVLQSCPKAAKKYFQFSGNALREIQKSFLEEVPEGVEISEVPEIGEEISQEYGKAVLLTNLRSLYSFFDEEGIVMELGVDRTTEPKFCYSFDTTNSDLFYTREEAEVAGFVKAFQKLEGQLNEKDS